MISCHRTLGQVTTHLVDHKPCIPVRRVILILSEPYRFPCNRNVRFHVSPLTPTLPSTLLSTTLPFQPLCTPPHSTLSPHHFEISMETYVKHFGCQIMLATILRATDLNSTRACPAPKSCLRCAIQHPRVLKFVHVSVCAGLCMQAKARSAVCGMVVHTCDRRIRTYWPTTASSLPMQETFIYFDDTTGGMRMCSHSPFSDIALRTFQFREDPSSVRTQTTFSTSYTCSTTIFQACKHHCEFHRDPVR
jgi:hypothetical protein